MSDRKMHCGLDIGEPFMNKFCKGFAFGLVEALKSKLDDLPLNRYCW